MVSAKIYLEGGGDSKELKVLCRRGFRELLDKAGFKGRMPRLVACGGRGSTFDDFKTAHETGTFEYVAMLIDSEEAVDDFEETWEHLKNRDGWEKPQDAENDQVLFMVTCMETWISADRETLKRHYGNDLQESALPPLQSIENTNRQTILQKLEHASRNCSSAYEKGKHSFALLGRLNPDVLEAKLQGFKRLVRILNEKL